MNFAMKTVAALIALQLTGCGMYQRVQDTKASIEKSEAGASTVLTQMRAGNATPGSGEVVSTQSGFWAPTQPIDVAAQNERQANDAVLNDTVVMTLWQPTSLRDFGQKLAKIAGMPVHITPDALAPATGDAASAGAGDPMISGIRHKGPMKELLDSATAKLGLSWKIADGAITIFRFDTRIFALNTVCTTSNLTSSIVSGTSMAASGGQGGGAANSGNSSQSTDVSTKSDLCGDIHKTISAMVTPGSGRVYLSTATNALVVTDTPPALQRIGGYLEKQKHLFSKQVLFNIKVLSVHVDESDGAGFDLDLVRNALVGKLGLKVAGSTALDHLKQAGSLGLTLTGKGDVSSATIKALSTLGRVSEITSPSITTLNMQPAPLQIGDQTTYVAKRSTTMAAQGTAQTEIQPGVVSSGFNMTLLPFVSDTNDMILQYSLNISALEKIDNFGDKKNEIQLPKVSNRIFNQSVRLQSGQTLVMGGFERTRDRADAQGTANPWLPLLGGGVGQSKSRDIIVVLITPTVM